VSGAEGIAGLLAAERARFAAERPVSLRLAAAARGVWRGGTPLHWMGDWASPSPIFAERGEGARLIDADGLAYDDFCLGDTPAMFGHGEARIAEALAAQARRGAAFMLPTAEAVVVGRLLAERFGLPFWQVTATASDANRYVLRWARSATGRQKVLVFNGCYHGSVDDTFVRLKDGRPILRPGLIGQAVDVTKTTKVVEFNDLPALEAALKPGDVACVICEPAMTNIGMVLPEPGYHAALRALTRQHGTLLAIDETHSISTGRGGYTRAHGLEPDFFVLGKPIAGGIPAAVFGFTADLAAKMAAAVKANPGYSGMGTTLSANPLVMAAMRANLEQVMTEAAYDRMLALSDRLAEGLRRTIRERQLPWHVSNVGARAEFVCCPRPPRNGTEAAAAMQPALEHAIHLYLINRGFLIAPFHNMTLVCPDTAEADVDRLVGAVRDCCDELRTG
jgi:glutamate-1-semialdehyde 2,1-aminomutase